MKQEWKKFKLWNIIISGAILVLGIVMIVWPNISALVVCYILGILCLAYGIYEIVRYFSLGLAGVFFQFDLAIGLFSILAGLLMVMHPQDSTVFLPLTASLYILINSIFDIQLAVEMRRYGMKKWWVSMLLGVVSTVLAFLLFLDPFSGVQTLMIFAGITLIINSLENFYTVGCISKAIKASHDNKVIDITWDNL